MADLISRLSSVVQDPSHSESDRRWASDQLVQIKSAKDRLMSVAGDDSLPHDDRNWARSQLVQLGPMQPSELTGSIRPSTSLELSSNVKGAPTADEALGLGEEMRPDLRKPKDTIAPIDWMGIARTEGNTSRAMPWEDRKRMMSVVGGGLAGLGAGVALAPVAAGAAALLPEALSGIGGLGAAAATGAGSGYVQGTTQGLLAGRGMADANREGIDSAKVGAVIGPLGHMAGEAASLVGPLLKKGSDVLRKNHWIGKRADAAEAGLYDTPEMQSLPSGLKGERRASEVARDKIIARDAQMTEDAGKKYQTAVAPERGKTANLEPAVQDLYNLQSTTRYSAGDPMMNRQNISGAVDKTFDDLVRQGPEGRTVGDLMQSRMSAGETAGFGANNPTESQAANQKIYHALRNSIRQSAPEVGKADDAYTAFKAAQERRNDILYRSEDGGRVVGGKVEPSQPVALPDAPDELAVEAKGAAQPLKMRVGDEMKAATAIGRIGDETVPGQAMAPYLEQLGKQDPEFARALQLVEAKKALEGTSLHFQDMLPENLHGAAAHFMGLPAGFIRQNARGIGSLAERGMRAAANGSVPNLAVNPVVRAYIIQKAADDERQQRLSDLVKSGGR